MRLPFGRVAAQVRHRLGGVKVVNLTRRGRPSPGVARALLFTRPACDPPLA